MVRSGGLRGQVADFGVVLVVVAIVVVSFAGIAVADEPDPGDIDSEITISEPPDSIAPGQEFETDVSFSLYNPACASYTIVLYEVDRGVVTNDRTKIAEKKYLLSATEFNTPVTETLETTVSGETLDGDGQAELRAEIHNECSTGTGASSDIFEVPVTEPPENDRFEPNDEWQSAFPVSDSTFTSSRGQITPGDIDWYQLPVSEGQTLSVEAAARTQNGELRMRVYAPDGSGDFRSASGASRPMDRRISRWPEAPTTRRPVTCWISAVKRPRTTAMRQTTGTRPRNPSSRGTTTGCGSHRKISTGTRSPSQRVTRCRWT